MRITEKNTPILRYLRWNKPLTEHPDFGSDRLGLFVIQDDDASSLRDAEDARVLGAYFLARWPELAAHYSESVEVISEAFNEAMWTNAEKVFNEETIKTCTNRYYRGTLIHGPVTLCYDFFFRDNGQVAGNCMLHIKDNLVLLVNGERRFVSQTARKHYNTDDWTIVKNQFKEILVLHLFKRFADIETVQSNPFKKVNIPEGGGTLLVDSTIPVTYTDCSWYRTIVRNEGFMVRGHFRLQPYKDGRKLIYIEPFQKHGYVRRAKKDLPQNQTQDKD